MAPDPADCGICRVDQDVAFCTEEPGHDAREGFT